MVESQAEVSMSCFMEGGLGSKIRRYILSSSGQINPNNIKIIPFNFNDSELPFILSSVIQGFRNRIFTGDYNLLNLSLSDMILNIISTDSINIKKDFDYFAAHTKVEMRDGMKGNLELSKDVLKMFFRDSLNNFSRIPHNDLEDLLINLGRSFKSYPPRDFKVNLVSEETFSLGIGILSAENLSTNEISTLYFKAYENPDDAYREAITLQMIPSTISLVGNTGSLCRFTNTGILNYGKTYFIVTHDTTNLEFLENINKNNLKSKVLKSLNFDPLDKYTSRMYTLASFHTEMSLSNMGFEKNKLFNLEMFKSIETIKKQLGSSFEDLFNYSLIKQYENIVEEHNLYPKNIISHNDTRDENWVNNCLIDFGRVSWGQEYSDVEKALFSSSLDLREKYRLEYFKIRTEFSRYFGLSSSFDKKNSFQDFSRRSKERGLTDSIRLLSYSINKGSSLENEYLLLSNLNYYRSIL